MSSLMCLESFSRVMSTDGFGERHLLMEALLKRYLLKRHSLEDYRRLIILLLEMMKDHHIIDNDFSSKSAALIDICNDIEESVEGLNEANIREIATRIFERTVYKLVPFDPSNAKKLEIDQVFEFSDFEPTEKFAEGVKMQLSDILLAQAEAHEWLEKVSDEE